MVLVPHLISPHGLVACNRIDCASLVIINVTRPAKIGHVGTNYTPSHNRSYLSTGTEYLHSVTCIINQLNVYQELKIALQ